ncbi:hypothetical protein Tsubulata_022562 [Turnera subulata]|uniref:Uncharacterized protein n=1 Tax=Turnera subulata TaxID=218843 RepID=A0A9Q0GIH4_9ROSI|nr:hypothetical protein Tsubulata_022562 [Turnera subulata]
MRTQKKPPSARSGKSLDWFLWIVGLFESCPVRIRRKRSVLMDIWARVEGWEDEEEKRESRKDAVDEPVEERVGRDGVVGGEVEDGAVLVLTLNLEVNGEDEPFQRGA